ncbi:MULTISPECIES: hypothetical protein [Burkholderia]|uniref:hypothetical protein n=1 Tax=Burkholderia TaxID=32008 RepID=UPI0018C664FA|nr:MULTISPECIES: hypothetical protein [Burkholderia]MEB2529721.1 hypothetical protein [Burkholderia anthinoferrum]MEB2565263.1 hypothetical protein [Burkholderia anthinoferrum]MCA8239977.1 hypothetical protein [Burkholderia sp. AU32262]MDF3096710.1 hypothetical protein [Burkholderia semiarida]MDF3115271.1 hypothetical protein [Burkholderia semiarida]
MRRSKLLPRPLSLTFQSEEEGDAYVARLEHLLVAGIVPADVVQQREAIATTLDLVREYLRKRGSVPSLRNTAPRLLRNTLFAAPSNVLVHYLDSMPKNLAQFDREAWSDQPIGKAEAKIAKCPVELKESPVDDACRAPACRAGQCVVSFVREPRADGVTPRHVTE